MKPFPTVQHRFEVGALPLQVRKTERKGYGLFATTFIRQGALVLKLGGQTLRTQDVPEHCLAMQIDHDLWLCSDGSLLDDYVNHSCDPNTGFLRHDPVLYALRDIQADEELSWDYSTSITEPGWKLACLCESKNCRKTVLPYVELTPAQREQLRPIALQYLRDK